MSTTSTDVVAKSGFLTLTSLQKAVAFAVLLALLAFFSVFAENFAAWNNMVNIMQATSINGVLAVAVTHTFVSGDSYLTSDAVFGVKASLIAPFERVTGGATAWRSPFDFVLVPVTAQ